MGTTEGRLQKHAGIMELIKQSSNYYRFYKSSQGEQDEGIEREVELAIQQLEVNGQAITLTAIAKIVGVHPTTLRKRLKSKELIDCSVIKEQRRKQRENTLVLQVESAIEQLRSLGRPITQGAIVKIVGISAQNLRAYPRVETLIEESMLPDKRYKRRTSRDENDMLEKVELAIQGLSDCDQRVTLAAIVKTVGISKQVLKAFPKVDALLQQCNDERYLIMSQQTQKRGRELTLKVKQAIQELEAHAVPVTQSAVARLLGMSAQGLMRYIQVRELLQQYEPPEQVFSAKEERLVKEVEAAIRELEAGEQVFSVRKVCKMTGHSKEMLYNFPKVRAILLRCCEREQDLRKVRMQQREEEALGDIRVAIEQLKALGQPITGRTLSKILKKDPASLYYYPKVAALLKDEIKGKSRQERLRQRQNREEELVQKVLEVGEQLRTANQPVTIRAIAGRLQLSPGQLTRYPKVREHLDQFIQKRPQE
jgi:AcrR family transcriptional regulator